jgi:hypothetical protein
MFLAFTFLAGAVAVPTFAQEGKKQEKKEMKKKSKKKKETEKK